MRLFTSVQYGAEGESWCTLYFCEHPRSCCCDTISWNELMSHYVLMLSLWLLVWCTHLHRMHLSHPRPGCVLRPHCICRSSWGSTLFHTERDEVCKRALFPPWALLASTTLIFSSCCKLEASLQSHTEVPFLIFFFFMDSSYDSLVLSSSQWKVAHTVMGNVYLFSSCQTSYLPTIRWLCLLSVFVWEARTWI